MHHGRGPKMRARAITSRAIFNCDDRAWERVFIVQRIEPTGYPCSKWITARVQHETGAIRVCLFATERKRENGKTARITRDMSAFNTAMSRFDGSKVCAVHV